VHDYRLTARALQEDFAARLWQNDDVRGESSLFGSRTIWADFARREDDLLAMMAANTLQSISLGI
jgi:hypothetical protein